MNNLDLYQVNIDWLKVVNLALKRKGWGQKYVLYKLGNTSVSCVMKSFNFAANEATFDLRVDNIHDKYPDYERMTLYYKLDNFTPEEFKNYVNRRVVTLLTALMATTLRKKAEDIYNGQRIWSFRLGVEEYEKYTKEVGLTKEWNFIDTIEDNDFRETYVDQLQDRILDMKNAPYFERIQSFIENTKLDYGTLELLRDQVRQVIKQ